MTTTAPNPRPAVEPITEPQMKRLMVAMREAGLDDRDEALEWARGVLGRPLDSRKDLTSAEASELIDRLQDGSARRQKDPDRAETVTVQEAIRRVAYDIGQVGVGKGGYNQQQNYRFRGIDQFVDALSPILARHGVVILPTVQEPRITEHPTARGGVQFMVVILVGWQIVGPAGDYLTATTIGQAMDASDKAANKAMSAAFKYLLGQVFAIPHDGWVDGDNDSPTVEARQPAPPAQPAQPAPRSNQHLLDRIMELAIEAGMTVEDLTAKFRRDRGNMTVEQFANADASLLSAYIRRVEAYNAQQAALQQQGAAGAPSN